MTIKILLFVPTSTLCAWSVAHGKMAKDEQQFQKSVALASIAKAHRMTLKHELSFRNII